MNESFLSNALLAVASLLLTVVAWIVREVWSDMKSVKGLQGKHETRIALLEQVNMLRREGDMP